ncbi:MAG: N-6 DNA methylase [Gemmatimonadetes bacterium]|nr:N-6 DNA methylase [Gemmatimonadota bacterium]
MSSLHRAAELLVGSSTLRGAERVAASLGFEAPHPLDRDARERFGLADEARRVFVAGHAGSLRCCIVPATADQVARQLAARCAARLAERAPHALWFIIVVQPATSTLILALPPQAGSGRVAALVVDTRRVQDSDAETLAAMADATAGGDAMTHQRWRELLGREALTGRFYRELEICVDGLASSARGGAPDAARREIALLCTSRILFLAFLEAKGWLDGDREFLRHRFDDRCIRGGNVHRRLLDPLFFGTLNTPVRARSEAARSLGRVPFLNGGLFARAPVERRWRDATLTDDGIGRVVCGLLGRYRVTAREESMSWSEAAIDPEMLGRAFESLMATDDRRRSGAFFTPLPLIERVATAGIDEWLAIRGASVAAREAARSGEPIAEPDRSVVLDGVADVRVLDPACGSGAFLVHVLERLADLRFAAGDLRPTSSRRRDVLTRSIFGVDVNPMAVWLCELRLWLSMVIDAADRDGLGVAPLPNLDHHVRVGDALSGPAFGAHPASTRAPALADLRRRYSASVGVRKRSLARLLDAEERREALADVGSELTSLAARRRDLLAALRGRDLFHARLTPSAGAHLPS